MPAKSSLSQRSQVESSFSHFLNADESNQQQYDIHTGQGNYTIVLKFCLANIHNYCGPTHILTKKYKIMNALNACHCPTINILGVLLRSAKL